MNSISLHQEDALVSSKNKNQNKVPSHEALQVWENESANYGKETSLEINFIYF